MTTMHDSSPAKNHPNEQNTKLPRPAWAEESRIDRDVINFGDVCLRHTWTAPTHGEAWCGGERGPVHVDIQQLHVLADDEGEGVTVTPEKAPVVYLSWFDGHFDSTEEARKVAAAILACCDRLDAAAGMAVNP
jgi:hypothetical protein